MFCGFPQKPTPANGSCAPLHIQDCALEAIPRTFENLERQSLKGSLFFTLQQGCFHPLFFSTLKTFFCSPSKVLFFRTLWNLVFHPSKTLFSPCTLPFSPCTMFLAPFTLLSHPSPFLCQKTKLYGCGFYAFLWFAVVPRGLKMFVVLQNVSSKNVDL